MAEYRQVVFRGPSEVALLPFEPPVDSLPPAQVEGRALYSTVSSGTETAVLQGHLGAGFPATPGYAAVLELTAIGSDVADLQPGDIVFAFAGHRSHSRVPACEALRVPDGLSAERAGLARLMGVSMSTLVTTDARPPDEVMVFGLGIVGLLGAQVFQAAGYEVLAVDPNEQRRRVASELGLRVLPEAPLDDPQVAGQVSLVLECSGHEAAVLAALKIIRRRGEVVLVGVPWVQLAQGISAFDILHAVFHNYAVLRSGWEWEIPRHPTEFRAGSIFGNLRAALQWLAEGKVRVEGLYEVFSPADAPRVYDGLIARSLQKPAAVFDWSQL